MSSTDTIHGRCLDCGATFEAPADAAEHYFEVGHRNQWSLPLSWLRQAETLSATRFFAWAREKGAVRS